jgi:hypothetical protein
MEEVSIRSTILGTRGTDLHVAKLGELLRATVQNTCERLSIGVCPLMRSHITLLDECLVTLAALERLFSGVSSYVSLDQRGK